MNLSEIVLSLHFLDVTHAPVSVTDKVREIRNEVSVRRNMYTDHLISKEEHADWLTSLIGREDRQFFAVKQGDDVIGGVGLSAINMKHKRADWAYFLTGAVRGAGIGPALEFSMIDFAFEIFDLCKLNCEVIAWNSPVVKLHKRFGFVEEGTRRHHVWRNGAPHDVVLLGLTDDEWRKSRAMLTERLFAGL